MRQFDTDLILFAGTQSYLALFEAAYCHCAQEIACETMAKQVKKRISDRHSLDRKRLDKDVFVVYNGPSVFKMSRFQTKCSAEFLSHYRPPMVKKSKYNESRIIDRHKSESSPLNWSKSW